MNRSLQSFGNYRAEGAADFVSCANEFGPPQAVVDIVRSATPEDISSYPDRSYTAVKEALAGYTGRHHEEVFVTGGGTDVFFWVSTAVRPGRVVVIGPCEPASRIAAENVGAVVIEHILKAEDSFDLDARRATEEIEKADLLILANPNTLTGSIFKRKKILKIAARLKPGAVMLVDESFMDFHGGEGSTLLPEISDGLWVARSLNRFFSLAGLRVGYLLATPSVVRRLEERAAPWRIGTLAEKAAAAAVADAGFIREVRRRNEVEREHLARLLAELGCLEPLPSAANFLLVEIKHPTMDSKTLTARLSESGFLVRDGSDYNGLGSRYFRLAVRGREDNEALVKAIAGVLSRE